MHSGEQGNHPDRHGSAVNDTGQRMQNSARPVRRLPLGAVQPVVIRWVLMMRNFYSYGLGVQDPEHVIRYKLSLGLTHEFTGDSQARPNKAHKRCKPDEVADTIEFGQTTGANRCGHFVDYQLGNVEQQEGHEALEHDDDQVGERPAGGALPYEAKRTPKTHRFLNTARQPRVSMCPGTHSGPFRRGGRPAVFEDEINHLGEKLQVPRPPQHPDRDPRCDLGPLVEEGGTRNIVEPLDAE